MSERIPQIATSSSWKREPFTAGIAIPYATTFAAEQMERLRQGLVPRQMEDKWFVFYEPPHLFLHRSWTGLPVFRVTLADREGGAQVVEALWAWPSKLDASLDPEYQAQLLDFLIGNLLLGECKPFPMPSNLTEPAPGVFQHHAAGTGYPNRSEK